jgi:hypothetical protein
MSKDMTGATGGEKAWELLDHMEQMTWDRHAGLSQKNAADNAPRFSEGQSLAALLREEIGSGDTATVIAAGPSVKRRDPANLVKQSGYKGAVVASESAISYCLRNGVVPDLAVTVDPGIERVVRWLGDPDLTPEKLAADDYFARQDQDDAFADEMRANEEILELLDKHGSSIRIALSTTSAKVLVDRVFDAGLQVYWFNPMLDDPDVPGSATAKLQAENGFPSVNAGGNVGTLCWLMAGEVLRKKNVALTGVDFSYYDDTPYLNTQYYYEAVDLVGEENLDSLFTRFYNPHVEAWFFTDPAYLWYRQCFLEMAEDSDYNTYNCTEGGILFGNNIECLPFKAFLETVAADVCS